MFDRGVLLSIISSKAEMVTKKEQGLPQKHDSQKSLERLSLLSISSKRLRDVTRKIVSCSLSPLPFRYVELHMLMTHLISTIVSCQQNTSQNPKLLASHLSQKGGHLIRGRFNTQLEANLLHCFLKTIIKLNLESVLQSNVLHCTEVTPEITPRPKCVASVNR